MADKGTLRQPQNVSWADNDQIIDPNDPVALTERQLAAAGGIDTTKRPGDIRNPYGQRVPDAELYVPPNDYYIDRVGRVRQGTVPVGEVSGEFGTADRAPSTASPLSRRAAELQFMVNPSEKSRVEAISKAYPDATFGRASNGRVVVKVPGGKGWQYLNAPGVSGQDVQDVLVQGLMFAPASLAAKGAATISQAGLRIGAASAGISAAQDVVTGQPIDPTKAALAGGMGLAGEYAGSAINALARGAGRAVEAATPAPVRGAISNTLATARSQLGHSFGADARAAVNPLAPPSSGMIPKTRGEMTGDFGQIAFEQAAMRNARGDEAATVLRGFSDERANVVRNVGRGLAGSETVPTMQDAGGVLQGGMRGRAQTAKENVDTAYSALRDSDARIAAPTVAELPGRIKAALENDFFSPEVMTSLNPLTRRIFAEVEGLAKSAPRAGEGVDPDFSLPVAGIERIRQGINRAMTGAQGNDRAALSIVKREFDDWLGDAVDQELIKGDPGVINTLKTARRLHADYRKTFGGGRGDDQAQAIIRKLIDSNANETDAVHLLFGRAGLGGAGPAVEAVKKIKAVAGNGPEVAALREGAVMRLMGRLDRNAGAGSTNINYKALADDWNEALTGAARPLMRELFTRDEIGTMQQFVRELRQITPPEGTVNRSGSGYEASRAIQQLLGKLKIIAPVIKGMDDAANATRAQAAVAGAPSQAVRLPHAGTAGAVYGATQGSTPAPF